MTDDIKILLIDDEEEARFLIEAVLHELGYTVVCAADGPSGIRLLEKEQPHVVLLDLNMPEPDGHQVCMQIKRIPKYSNLPILILTSSSDLNDKLNSFQEGADDYITKDMDPQEMDQRIRAVMRRFRQNLDSNPLTHLPGNYVIQKAIQERIDGNTSFAVAYCDLDNFKAYNDKYGFVAGDEILLFIAEALRDAVRKYGADSDFVGHVGGDDFVFLSSHQDAPAICQAVITRIENEIGSFYDEADRAAGFIISKNRQGQKELFPLVSISIAVVSNHFKKIRSIAEVSKIASELKKLAKGKTGNSYVFDKRTN